MIQSCFLRKFRTCRGLVPSSVFRTSVNCIESEAGSKSGEEKVKKDLEEGTVLTSESEETSQGNEWATSPYPKGTYRQSQGKKSFRPNVDPRETSIILFPGQGTQFVGMGKALLKFPQVPEMFNRASEILKVDLLKLCTEGPPEKLDQTKYAQAAILVCSLAALERLKEERPSAIERCIATAGFSLGEITALVFAEALTFDAAIKLVKVRGEAMQLASDMTPGAMVNVLFGPSTNLSKVCKQAREAAEKEGVENPYCAISNYLFPHGKIIGGHVQAINYLKQHSRELDLKRVKQLPVSGAFHTPLMEPAIEPFKEMLKKIKINDPVIAVHSNIDGKVYRDANHIRKRLPLQILLPVKWEQTLHILYERPPNVPYPMTYEVGPGNSLSVILKMVNFKAWHDLVHVAV